MVSQTPLTNPEAHGGDLEQPKLLKRRDMSPRFDIVPEQKEFGHQRGMAAGLNGTSVFVHLAVILYGQTAPPHSNTAEHVIFHLSGDIEWTVAGRTYRLEEQGDMLFIPAGTEYSFVNRAGGNSLFVAILGRKDDWPPRGKY
jgi:quercetin dioxygenase-like cupin family protein